MSEVRNPYAAPDAAVADVDVSANLPRPVQVTRACLLMWISLGINVITMPITQARQADALGGGIPMSSVIVGTAFGLVIGGLLVWWFTSKLSAGRNWMRVLLNILFGISALVLLGSIGTVASLGSMEVYAAAFAGPLDVVVTAVQVVLSIAVLVLINVRPARQWFLAMRRQPR